MTVYIRPDKKLSRSGSVFTRVLALELGLVQIVGCHLTTDSSHARLCWFIHLVRDVLFWKFLLKASIKQAIEIGLIDGFAYHSDRRGLLWISNRGTWGADRVIDVWVRVIGHVQWVIYWRHGNRCLLGHIFWLGTALGMILLRKACNFVWRQFQEVIRESDQSLVICLIYLTTWNCWVHVVARVVLEGSLHRDELNRELLLGL